MQAGLTILHVCVLHGHVNTLRALVKELNMDPDEVDNVSNVNVCLYALYAPIAFHSFARLYVSSQAS